MFRMHAPQKLQHNKDLAKMQLFRYHGEILAGLTSGAIQARCLAGALLTDINDLLTVLNSDKWKTGDTKKLLIKAHNIEAILYDKHYLPTRLFISNVIRKMEENEMVTAKLQGENISMNIAARM